MANKEKMLTLRLGDEERQMLKELKEHPYYINVSEYLRACIRHLYKSRVSKAGRVGTDKASLPPPQG